MSLTVNDISKQVGHTELQRKTYAAAMRSDLAKVVKSVVSDSIKTQLSSEKDSAYIVIHRLAESSDDRQRIWDLLQPFAALDSIVHIYSASEN